MLESESPSSSERALSIGQFLLHLQHQGACLPKFLEDILWLHKQSGHPFTIVIKRCEYRFRVFPATEIEHVAAGPIWIPTSFERVDSLGAG